MLSDCICLLRNESNTLGHRVITEYSRLFTSNQTIRFQKKMPETNQCRQWKKFIDSLNELIKWKRLLREKYADSSPEAVLNIGVNWVTFPARAPSFGGLWESSIKSMDLLLKKRIGKSTSSRWMNYIQLFARLKEIRIIAHLHPFQMTRRSSCNSLLLC